jgi:hypothetical protein
MSPPTRGTLLLFAGPALGISMVGLAILGNSGPGFLFFALAAAAGFVLIAPLIQLLLHRTASFGQRPGTALVFALAVVILGLFVISGASLFNQW